MNRRDFLKGAGAAFVPAAIFGSTASAPDAGAQPIAHKVSPGSDTAPQVAPITAVVYDERYADSTIFAGALARQGAVAFAADGDSAQLWYGPLRAHLAQYSGRVAGLTTYADFTVAQSCGRELSLASIYEGTHDARRSRLLVTHRVVVAADATEIAMAFAATGATWSENLAKSLNRFAPPNPSPRRAKFSATTERSPGHPGYLTSWLLADL
jgi:hypothetical protein